MMYIDNNDFPAGVKIPPPPAPKIATPPVDPAVEIQNKVAPRVAEARILKVIDQATLDLVGDRLAVNKALQKEAIGVFKPIKQKMDAAKAEVLKQEKGVLEPLELEETILKGAVLIFTQEQQRLADERARQERIAREAEERRLMQVAEEERQRQQAIINEQLEREHAEEIERALNELPADAPAEEVQALCDMPAPAPVVIPLDIPVLAQATRVEPTFVMPKGMSTSKKYKAEVFNLTLLCRAVAEGKVPATYVSADMAKLNSRARADGAAFSIPGVRAVEDTSISQRTR